MNQPPYILSVCGKHEVEQFAGAGLTHLLSLEDPGTPKQTPEWLVGEHLQLQFHDVDRAAEGPLLEAIAPGREHMTRILEFGARCLELSRTRRVHLLVHCYAGISRSSAAALALSAQAMGVHCATEAMAFVRGIRPGCMPNRLLVRHADALLGHRGELLQALKLFRLSLGLF